MTQTLSPTVLAAGAALFSATLAHAQPPQTPLVRTVGVDGLIGRISDATAYPPSTIDGVLMRPFAIGTWALNIGDRPLEWVGGTNQHAIISQNIYRATGKHFDQVGLGWLKHVGVAANTTFDPTLGPCISSGLGSSKLGVNCADLYGSGFNAAQALLGPRYDVNPVTGSFTYPFSTIVPPVVAGNTSMRRILTADSDVQSVQNPGATYYAETALYSPDDSLWGNGRNNFCAVRLAPLSLGASQSTLTLSGDSYRTSALEYWAWATPGIVLSRADLFEQIGAVIDHWHAYSPGDTSTPPLSQSQWVTLPRELWTRYVAAAGVTDNGDGTWTYDYAVLNMNSHRAGAAFALHLPAGATVSNTLFHAPAYHSGDRIHNVPWNLTTATGKLEWRVDPTTTTATYPSVGEVTLSPNALLFSAVHSFHVTVNLPPTTGSAHLGLYRPPADATGDQGASIAFTNMTIPAYCVADVGSTGGFRGPDGFLDNNDFIAFIDAFFAGDRFWADVGTSGGLPGSDNLLDNNDFIAFINAFFAGCP